MLKKSQKDELLAELRIEKEKKFADRIRIILLLDQGEPPSTIAKYFFIDEGTVRNYKKRYFEGGIEKLVNDHYVGRSSFLSEKQKITLIEGLESKVYPTTQSILEYVKNKFIVTYSVGGESPSPIGFFV